MADYFHYIEAGVMSFLLTLIISPFVISFMKNEVYMLLYKLKKDKSYQSLLYPL